MTSSYYSISDYNDESVTTESILDSKRLGTGKNVTRMALCEKCIVAKDTSGKPFLRYYFRDINGKLIIGRQWDIENLYEKVEDLPKYQNKVINVTFSINYWKGLYLDVTGASLVSDNVSSLIRSKFFTANIPELDKELSFFNDCVEGLLSNDQLKIVYDSFDTEAKLKEGYYSEVLDGMKGAPVKIFNIFSSLCITMFNKKRAKEMTKAFLFVEAIMSESSKDNNNIFRYLNQLKDLCIVHSDIEVTLIYKIVESTIDLMFNIERDSFISHSIFIKDTRSFIFSSLETMNVVDNSIGMFAYGEKIFERR